MGLLSSHVGSLCDLLSVAVVRSLVSPTGGEFDGGVLQSTIRVA